MILLLGMWLLVGMFVDGWVYNCFGEMFEIFFMFWYVLFYSGFLVVVGWCFFFVV